MPSPYSFPSAAQLRRFEGRNAIYRENTLLAHVTVLKIESNEEGMAAEVRLVKNLAPFLGDAPVEWSIMSSWEAFDFREDYWACPYVSWRLYFKDGLVERLGSFIEGLPLNSNPHMRFNKIVGFCIRHG